MPARDEAERIGACLRALAEQRGVSASEAYEVVVVLDGCRDATRERALDVAVSHPQLRLHLVELSCAERRGTRPARAAWTSPASACSRFDRPRGLIASTDADSVVAEDWLAAQRALAAAGASAIGGLIELDPTEAASSPRRRCSGAAPRPQSACEHVRQRGIPWNDQIAEHHQFSGASLALTAAAYRQCGGLPVSAALEDEALERELSNRGIPIHRSRAVRVSTSARTEGRAPRGLAHDLR